MSAGTPSTLAFLAGGGEMGALIRAKDWSKTPLGSPETWPQSLRTSVSICLNSRFPIVLLWGSNLILIYNDAYQQIIGAIHARALGGKGCEVWAEIWDTIGPMLNGVLARGEATWSENQLFMLERHGYPEECYFTYSYSPIHGETGGIGGVFTAINETTQQVLSDRQLHTLFEQAPVAIAILRGPTFRVELANPGMCEILNRPLDALLGNPIFEVLTEAAGQGFEELLTGVLETGVPFVGNELPVSLLRDGQPKTVYVNFVYAPQAEADGRITGITVVATDVTEQVLVRQKIEESNRWFRQLADSMPQIVWTAQPDGYLDYFNQRWYEYLGDDWGHGDSGWVPILHPDDRQPCLDHWQRCLQTGEPYRFEFRLDDPRNPGNYRWFLALATAFRDPESLRGQIIKWFGSCTEIDDQKRAEVALRESENRFRELADFVPQIVWTAQPDGQSDYYNRQWYDFSGFSEEYGDSGWTPILHPDDVQPTVAKWYESVESGTLFQTEYRFLDHRTGTYHWFLGRAIPVRDDEGTLVKWFGTATDIHDQKIATERLETLVGERTGELEQANLELQRTNLNLSQFAYVASHDLQEPLRKIQAFGNMLLKRNAAQLDEPGTDRIRRMQNAAERMSGLIQDLLEYSRVSSHRETFAPVDLTALLASVRSDLAVLIREKKAGLRAAALPTVQGDATQLRQVLQNLLSNALKFSRPDVPPVVEVRHCVVAGAETNGLALPPEGRFHEISVSDNGIGFDETYANRIFEAFQRLHGRADYPGTGIGLAIVKKVLENHYGGVAVSSRVGEGSTFRVYLPVED
ncbi:MAG: PAS domain-containing protein [Cytophagaceae bacterium]|nr:PAS domain-containing protein [Cytophagaceae bacterium]